MYSWATKNVPTSYITTDITTPRLSKYADPGLVYLRQWNANGCCGKVFYSVALANMKFILQSLLKVKYYQQ